MSSTWCEAADTKPRNKLQAHQDPKVQMSPPCQPTLPRACLLQLLLSLIRSADTYTVQPPAVTFHSPPHCLWCSRALGITVWTSATLQTPGRTCRVKGLFIPVIPYKRSTWLYAHVPSCTFVHVAVLSGWDPILWKKDVVEFLVSHRSRLKLSEHINVLRKGSAQPSQYVSVAIITTTKDRTVIAFPIKITFGRIVW